MIDRQGFEQYKGVMIAYFHANAFFCYCALADTGRGVEVAFPLLILKKNMLDKVMKLRKTEG